ncbi:TonB-dependent receptor plug domain-containing protein [Gayadomonas joobiniege]|uniref:TonB-dependent receptor plug domain-containing protein n=1 Tax=Gayadomonas joobiniege TaxID=1234606 RepID=UPI00037C88D9|nr:TonB-dependent receptor plug domain-containing protein [Gayadomonas joobiniege]
MNTQYRAKKISLAVALTFCSGTAIAQDAAMEEVVATASRLQGTAAAVIEERKNQAFVADILGAEQISRTGDSDAASALRRVTGLTLVDGKYIYVRGLGERYSSARLNGAAIPSPDLTRNVIPMDIFPTSVIESLSVQKSFSPNMPAAFGGGSVDIRTKSTPSEFTAGIQLGIGTNTNNSDGYTYDRNEGGLAQAVSNAIVQYNGDFSTRGIIEKDSVTSAEATEINKNLLKLFPRNLQLKQESLDPDLSFQGHIGNTFDEDIFGGSIGVLATVSYDNKWQYREGIDAVIRPENELPDNCKIYYETRDDLNNSCHETRSDSRTSTENERLNGLLTVGYRLNTHNLSYTRIHIEDNEDESSVGYTEKQEGNATIVENSADRSYEFEYQERTLEVDQFKGQHTFLDLMGLGFDWQYTDSQASTDIPLKATYNFADTFDNFNYVGSEVSGGNGQINYEFVEMDDFLKSYGGNVNLPLTISGLEIELKGGWDFIERGRYYTTSSFFVNNTGAPISVDSTAETTDDLQNYYNNSLGLTNYLSNDFIDNNNVALAFNEPDIDQADDYMAAQKVDAGYGQFDVFLDQSWRLSGGVRYERFQQVALEFTSSDLSPTAIETLFNEDKVQARTINEDDFYPALSLTYIGEGYQLRFGYGETVVRPDLREVVPVSYTDPLTDILTRGNTSLVSSTLKNYDMRYELYYDNGDNLALSAFYKDISKPIESVLQVGDSAYSAGFTNGESGELFGIEAEWLYDLSYLTSGLFTTGNLTLSDSEVTIAGENAGSLTNATKRMTGHSQYVVNLQLGYDSDNGEHSASLVYNVFGERIIASGIGGRQDAYEQPFHSLDAVYTYYPDFNTTVKLKLQNLLGEDQEVTQSDIVVRSRDRGVGASLSYRYEF